ncbi:caspase family protein [Tahibacter harae]|uniref:Caspase family protein n=1 Tax=Tahibacter harae TaxID=2963937 RepID=A0ABT1QMY4_9GAMM|nr:caspase family protein [Tahibacter harae]MCQ4163889.1 caspase family protein [Tahibacter harae]
MADQAIVIGIGSYPNFGADGSSPNDLAGAVQDAEDVADWLVKVGQADVTLITSTGVNGAPWAVTNLHTARPVVSDVDAAFIPYVKSAAPKVANRLYVYAAGHGLAPDPRSRCLILADAAGVRWVPNLEVPAWIDWFANQTHFDELVLWMDCCGTQALEYNRTRPAGLANTAERPPPPARVFTAFASGYGRKAYEGAVGPGGAVRGLFTRRLLNGLNGAAANLQGEVRSGSLANFLRNGALDGAAGESQFAMVPQEDDMLFAIRPHPIYRVRARRKDGTLAPDGTVLTLTSPPGPLQKTAPVIQGWVSFDLGVGLYKLGGDGVDRLFEIGALTPRDID